MATINHVSGKSYRVCTDADNDVYDELSFGTDASDVSFTDGTDAESNLGAIKGITSDLSCEDESIAVSAKAVNDSLGGFSFKTVDGKKQVSTDGGETWSNFSGGLDLLWTNPNPTSAFNAQTLSIDLSGYESVVIQSKGWFENAEYTPLKILVPKNGNQYIIAGNQHNYTESGKINDSIGVYMRLVTVNDDGITFTNAYVSDSQTNNQACIPLEIYGCGITLE